MSLLPNRRHGLALLMSCVVAAASGGAWAATNDDPAALIRSVATDVIEHIRADKAMQAGDVAKVMSLVDAKVMPHVNFPRMTATAVGRYWRQATEDQRLQLQQEFKTLLVRTYAGALGQLKDQTVVLKPARYRPEDTEVLVRSELQGRGEPVQLDYRLEKQPDGWKVFDINVLGIWLVDTYRGQFAQEVQARGIDGLIKTLTERNRSAAR